MKISLSAHQFFDDEGRPLASGRITVYLHGSDTPADLYTMEGDEYVQAENPVTCYEDGRIPTLFFDASVVDVKVEKSNLDGTFELLDTYEDGFDFASAKNDTVVYDIGSLHEANTEVGVVSVVGYDGEVYAPQRTYVWDPTCTELADDGVIVESDTTDTGRWILLWDDEKLPCTVYGIAPGKEANISAFLTYPDFVGQWSIRTPRIPRFLSGDYTSNTTFTTSRTIYFDEGARFYQAKFVCSSAIIPSNSGYVADFYFTDHASVAHSSWFRTLDAFLTCHASRFVVDGTNYFNSTAISYERELANVTLEYTTNTRLPITYTGGGKLTLSRVNIIGENIFTASDILYFKYTDIMDKWWNSPGNIDWVNKVTARSASLNNLRLDNFTSTTAYVNAIRANGATYLDLAGRKVSSIDASGFTEVNNVVANSISLSGGLSNIQMKNVKTDSLNITCSQLTLRDSVVTFTSTPSISSGFWAYDSTVYAQSPWTTGPQVIAERCSWNVSLRYANDNTSSHSWVEFRDCVFGVNAGFSLKMATFLRCMFPQGNTIKMYPRKDGSIYRLHLNMQDCTYNSAYPVEFTKFDNLDPNDEVYDCIVSWTIVGNTFLGNSEGLRCRYWQHRSGGNYDKTFVAFSNNNAIEYKGNRGNCPADTAKGIDMNNGTGCESMFYWLTLGESTATLDKHKKGPVMLSMKANTGSYHWNMAAVNGNGFAVRWKYTGNDGGEFSTGQGCYIYPWAHLNEPTNNGSLFDVGFTKFGKVEEADPSYYPYHWQFAW